MSSREENRKRLRAKIAESARNRQPLRVQMMKNAMAKSHKVECDCNDHKCTDDKCTDSNCCKK